MKFIIKELIPFDYQNKRSQKEKPIDMAHAVGDRNWSIGRPGYVQGREVDDANTASKWG